MRGQVSTAWLFGDFSILPQKFAASSVCVVCRSVEDPTGKIERIYSASRRIIITSGSVQTRVSAGRFVVGCMFVGKRRQREIWVYRVVKKSVFDWSKYVGVIDHMAQAAAAAAAAGIPLIQGRSPTAAV